MILLDLQIQDCDPRTASICREYWQVDESGAFVTKVNDIAIKYGATSLDILPLVKAHCKAISTTIKCSRCIEPYVFKQRQELRNRETMIGSRWLCPACATVDQKKDRAPTIEKTIQPRKQTRESPIYPPGNLPRYLEQIVQVLGTDLQLQTPNFGPLEGHLHVAAARGWWYKRELGLDVALDMAVDSSIPILIVSSQFTSVRIAARLLCLQSKIDYTIMNKANFTPHQHIAIMHAQLALTGTSIIIIGKENFVPERTVVSLIMEWRKNNYGLPGTAPSYPHRT